MGSGRDLQGMRGVRAEVGVVPVGVGEIEVDLDIALVGGIGEFADDVAAEGGLHDGVGEVARLDAGASGRGPVGAAADSGFGVEHGEAFVVLGGEGEHLHAGLLEGVHPLAGVEGGGIPGLVERHVLLPVFQGHLEVRPGFRTAMPDGVDAPVDPDSELHVLKGFVCSRRGVVVFGDGSVFNFGVEDDDAGRKSVGIRCWRLAAESGGCCESRCGGDEFSTVHGHTPAVARRIDQREFG